VVGARHFEGERPAVFIFNHQSNLDPLIVGRLIEHDFTSVGKKAAQNDPRVFLAARVMDVTYIDRSDTDSAKQSVMALGDKIAAGTSVMLAPEGTRMPTQKLGRFKKGAFHLAMAAKVPIVPIVLRNTGTLMAPGASLMHAGTADVAVLEPISTADWTAESLDARVEAVRQELVRQLKAHAGDTAEVAKALSCSRQDVHSWLERFAIAPEEYGAWGG